MSAIRNGQPTRLASVACSDQQLPIKCDDDANQLSDRSHVQATKTRAGMRAKGPRRKQCDLKNINYNHYYYYYLTLFSTMLSLSIISVVSILSQQLILVAVATAQSSSSLAINQQSMANLQQVEMNHNAVAAHQSAAFSHLGAQILMPSQQHQHQSSTQSNYMTNANNKRFGQVGAHMQPAFVLAAKNKAINFTHLAFDDATNSVYVGAANWLLQVGAASLRAEVALRTGPGQGGDSARDCSPADCPQLQPIRVDPSTLSLHHSQGQDLSIPRGAAPVAASTSQSNSLNLQNMKSIQQNYSSPLAASQRSSPTKSTSPSNAMTTTTSQPTTVSNGHQQQQTAAATTNNNFNKLLVIEPESRVLLACGSLNQGACRRHQLGALSNFSELIQMPVVSNDELASNVGLVVPSSKAGLDNNNIKVGPVLYVAATQHSRSDLYREMVPSISARYLEPASRAMQIIERSFTETAKIDISFELRDYYLVNYVHSFQQADFAYFATNQRKSPLRQLEEWGYISRLARLCLGDLSFQSYTELSLECKSIVNSKQATTKSSQHEHYNLLQDAQLIQASSQLAQQLGLDPTRTHSVFAGVFSQSKDHTMRSQARSAICLFPMEQIEAAFNENIAACLNGTSKTRDMNYIAGAVNDCPRATGRPANLANTCNEPIKLNGSMPLIAQPVITFDSDLLTSIGAFATPTSPVTAQSHQHNSNNNNRVHQHFNNIHRHHTILLAGTSEGELKRIALLDSQNQNHNNPSALAKIPRGHLLDSSQISDSPASPHEKPSPILADMLLLPPEQDQLQSALLATPNKLVKLRVNGCRLQSSGASNSTASISHSCSACAALEDPLCGWCSSAGACTSRHACLQRATPTHLQQHSWQPFDQIRCTDYEPLSPRSVAVQAPSGTIVEVNVPLLVSEQQRQQHQQLAWKLAQAQFQCQFDYLAHANKSQLVAILGSGSGGTHTKALQARLNLHTSTVSIGCPLPSFAHRPHSSPEIGHELRVKLSVKLDPNMINLGANDAEFIEQSLGFSKHNPQDQTTNQQANIERVLTFFDCVQLSPAGCSTCTSSSHNCAWCRHSNKCTFDSSHSEFGCHAHSGATNYKLHSNQQQQAIDKPASCPAVASDKPLAAATTPANPTGDPQLPQVRMMQHQTQEILIAHQSRKAIVIPLRPSVLPQIVSAGQQIKRSGGQLKVECLFELDEDSRARVAAKLVQSAPPESPNSPAIICQEMTFAYGDEVAIQRAAVQVIMNDNQIVETSEVILYKCHLFGVSPPAPTAIVHNAESAALLGGFNSKRHSFNNNNSTIAQAGPAGSDCSLCSSIERKFRCSWCQSACLFADSCPQNAGSSMAGAAPTPSSCPPPRIDWIYPTSGPLEGGTLVTIEGSNLGASEREIQDKITIGGLPCHLIMYSVSTRIVCKTSPASARMPPASTVIVGNRAGISSAHEMFHYKPVHLSGVSPRQGPVSGGTKLTLSGSNLNVGSRTQIFLDDIPCALEPHAMSSNQISCVTAPNLQFGPMQISKLRLVVDNSTHYFPHPFQYAPDPIITSIEPAESFISGGRLLLITGHHLSSPQSVKLVLYSEHKHLPINGTSCASRKDTLIACLTPAIPRSLVMQFASQTLANSQSNNHNNNYPMITPEMAAADLLSPQGGGFKLRMFLVMDDVKSARNLEDYYHHLPHHITYFEDPKLHRLAGGLVEYTPELVIEGENLQLAQLDQDILITIGMRATCLIKSLDSSRLICEPPAKIEPQFDVETGKLLERANLAITGLVGSHLSYPLGHMQYTSQQYLPASQQQQQTQSQDNIQTGQLYAGVSVSNANSNNSGADNNNTATVVILLLSLVSSAIGLLASVAFAMRRRARQHETKKHNERQYKRIQLQMGSLDANVQPGSIFSHNAQIFANDTARQRAALMVSSSTSGGAMSRRPIFEGANHSIRGCSADETTSDRASRFLERARQMRLRALDYITRRSVFKAPSNQADNGRGLGPAGVSSTSTSSSLVFNGGKSDTYYVAGASSTLFAGPLAGDLIQANIIQPPQPPPPNNNHHLVLSKLTPSGKIVSSAASSALQRRPSHNITGPADNNNIVTSLMASPGNVASHALSGGQGATTLNFASHPMAQSYGFATSTSPLVSYATNYNQNINMADHHQQHHHQRQQHRATRTNASNTDHSPSSSSCQSTSSSPASSQQCSPGSSTRTPPSNSSKQRLVGPQQKHQQNSNQNGPMHHQQQNHFSSWTQEAPSTVVPYSVIDACNNNLTLEGINAIKQFV